MLFLFKKMRFNIYLNKMESNVSKKSGEKSTKEEKMIIIRVWGGLGNQLFLYALYEKMLSLGKEAYIYVDKRSYSVQSNPNATYQLPLLGLDPAEFPESERLERYLTSRKLHDRVMRRFDRRLCYEGEGGKFDPNILKKNNAFLSGYFQTEKYFQDIGDTIRGKIHFTGSDDNTYSEILKGMRKDNSVSLHVRLTDYLTFKELFGGICGDDYYRTAIEKIKERVNDPVFYLFSDDLDAAERMLSGYEVVPVRLNRGSKSYLDMFLMSQCRHHIIANSSFSWWGAWLDPRSDKTVIAPKRWLNTAETPDICPDNWIRVE